MSRPSKLSLIAAYLLLILGIQAGCLILFRLSQFGQTPFPELPTAVLVFFGALFISPLLSLAGAFNKRQRLFGAVVGGAAALLFSAVLSGVQPGAARYALAPLTALVLAELYPRLFRDRARLFAAMTVFIACTLLANYTLDSFIPLPGYGLVNVGTLFFGITFTQRDRVHQFGRRYAYWMIFAAGLANVVVALSLETPLRYVGVSLLAIVLSEVADTEVYQHFISRRWLTRVATSNAVSIPIDTLIFTVLAFYGEAWATPAWMTEVIVTDIIVKLAVGFLAALGILSLSYRRSPKVAA